MHEIITLFGFDFWSRRVFPAFTDMRFQCRNILLHRTTAVAFQILGEV